MRLLTDISDFLYIFSLAKQAYEVGYDICLKNDVENPTTVMRLTLDHNGITIRLVFPLPRLEPFDSSKYIILCCDKFVTG